MVYQFLNIPLQYYELFLVCVRIILHSFLILLSWFTLISWTEGFIDFVYIFKECFLGFINTFLLFFNPT